MLYFGYQAYDFLTAESAAQGAKLRKGYLFAVSTRPEGGWGYADWFLWPELGDPEETRLDSIFMGLGSCCVPKANEDTALSAASSDSSDIFGLFIKPLLRLAFESAVLQETWAQVVREWEQAFQPYAAWLLPIGAGRETWWHVLTNALQCHLQKNEIITFLRRKPRYPRHWLVRHLLEAPRQLPPWNESIPGYAFTLKVKLPPSLAPQSKEIFCQWLMQQPQLKLRLDFNGQWSEEQVWAWLKDLPDLVKSAIEFIEDPCPWSLEAWKKLNKEIPLAMDWILAPGTVPWKEAVEKRAFCFGVWKPSRQSFFVFEQWPKEIAVVLTTQLGHVWDWYWTMWSYEHLKNKCSSLLISPVLGLSTWDH